MHVSLISEKLSIWCVMKVFFTAFFNMVLGETFTNLSNLYIGEAVVLLRLVNVKQASFLIVVA